MLAESEGRMTLFETADSVFFGMDDFEVDPNDGRRLCRRCGCCEVGVSTYHPAEPLEGSIMRARFHSMRVVPSTESLLRDPAGIGEEAWFCKGGCDERGEHPTRKKGDSSKDFPL